MRQVLLIFLSLMSALPIASTLSLQSFSCDQSWSANLPYSLISSLAFSSDGTHMAVGEFIDWAAYPPGFPNSTNHLIYITPQLQQITFNPLGTNPYAPWRITMSEDGRTIVSTLKGGGVQLFNAANPLHEWKLPGGVSDALGLSGDGKNLAALVLNKTSNMLYLLATTDPYSTVWSYRFAPSIGNTTSYQDVGISFDGSRIATLMGRSLFVFSSNNNQTLWNMEVESSQTDPSDVIGASETQVFMSHDGNHLITVEDENITIYSASTGKVEKSLILRGAYWPSLLTPDETFTISKDASTLAAAQLGKLNVFDLNSGTVLFSKTILDQFTLGTIKVTEEPQTVALSQNGTTIVVGGQQNGVFVFDRAGNELCKTNVGYVNYGATANVKMSDDGTQVAAFAGGAAALIAVTPHYTTLILISGVSLGAVTIIHGYLIIRRRRRNRRSQGTSPTNVNPTNTSSRRENS